MGYSHKVFVHVYIERINFYILEGYSAKKTLTLIIQRILKSKLHNFDKVHSQLL